MIRGFDDCEDLVIEAAAAYETACPEHFQVPEIELGEAKDLGEAFSSPGLVMERPLQPRAAPPPGAHGLVALTILVISGIMMSHRMSTKPRSSAQEPTCTPVNETGSVRNAR